MDLSIINNVPWKGLVFEIENKFFLNIRKEYSQSLIQEYNIDEYLANYLSILPNEIELTKSFYGKKISFINWLIDNLPTEQIEYIAGDIDLLDYTKFKKLKL